MSLHSLRTRLLGLWSLSLVASVVVGILLVQLYHQSARAQVGRAQAVIARACDLIQDRYGFYISGWSAQASQQADQLFGAGLISVLTVALAHQEGVEGGIWQANGGSLAYAYPTYQGTGPKTDLPIAESEEIQTVNERSVREAQAVAHEVASRTQTLLLHACALGGPITGLTAWTMTRVQSAPGLGALQVGLAVLFALMVTMAAWLGRTLLIWGRHVRAIESVLGRAGPDGMPAVPPTGERELDQIINALNDAGQRLSAAQQESEALASRVARAERLAGLGRVAAGIAHEIRNPIAAARLQGENALAGDDARRRQAITDMLGQIDRLDAHVGELLAMTQRVEPRPVRIDLEMFLAGQAARHKETAAAKGVALTVQSEAGAADLDPAVIGRVLDNLLTNAIRHAPAGGAVTLVGERTAGRLLVTVADTGPGVPPEMHGSLFEPFVTGRPDGTGLGLAIARELADAHNGRLILRPAKPGAGAIFELMLPQESAWPQS